MSGPDTFDDRIAAWTEQQHSPWLRLRYELAHRNLVRHLDPSPLRILDAGGGNARDALPLAMLGHTVTVVDFSAAMLADARQSAEAGGGAIHTRVMKWGERHVPGGCSAT